MRQELGGGGGQGRLFLSDLDGQGIQCQCGRVRAGGRRGRMADIKLWTFMFHMPDRRFVSASDRSLAINQSSISLLKRLSSSILAAPLPAGLMRICLLVPLPLSSCGLVSCGAHTIFSSHPPSPHASLVVVHVLRRVPQIPTAAQLQRAQIPPGPLELGGQAADGFVLPMLDAAGRHEPRSDICEADVAVGGRRRDGEASRLGEPALRRRRRRSWAQVAPWRPRRGTGRGKQQVQVFFVHAPHGRRSGLRRRVHEAGRGRRAKRAGMGARGADGWGGGGRGGKWGVVGGKGPFRKQPLLNLRRTFSRATRANVGSEAQRRAVIPAHYGDVLLLSNFQGGANGQTFSGTPMVCDRTGVKGLALGWHMMQ